MVTAGEASGVFEMRKYCLKNFAACVSAVAVSAAWTLGVSAATPSGQMPLATGAPEIDSSAGIATLAVLATIGLITYTRKKR